MKQQSNKLSSLNNWSIMSIIVALTGILLIAIGWLLPYQANAKGSYLNSMTSQYPQISSSKLDNCAVCHPSGGGNDDNNLNSFARDYMDNGKNFAAIENFDSDGDGAINIDEINALTLPGDANDKPVVATATSLPPTATSTATSLPPTATPTATAIPATATQTPETVSTTISGGGGELNSIDVSVEFPAGAVDTDTIVSYAHLLLPNPSGFLGIDRSFQLTAMQGGSIITSDFKLPVTITVKYPADLSISKDKLKLYYQKTDNSWSTDGITTTVSNTDTELTSTTTHFSKFAVLTEGQSIYLPVIIR
ncbi:hypothetical protein QUF64_04185 [Anaerolineales bacterium HSG6]|nr:hypothetical protein [Anaerolineales bacterium HSG6]MDM8532030.1 hypothetical protein [Anaerolineales bacterium HSG25]